MVMLWLEESVKEVLRRVDVKDSYVEECQNRYEISKLKVCRILFTINSK